MSMLVSDYDGTYANGERNLSLNSYAINGLLWKKLITRILYVAWNTW